ncbi:hypothetical protein E1176_09650 [Fulvivirga sp. RKSG066]|uniref:hypothetical protein n=1 Tax=Fulvivirga aurantia TaxID=2529383 RepID=UPI0012BC10E5|nr:hypothetical protein [Fulvivirga aurantia]MTI21284.1 hypothetical protein [Fulvivirga aurantia]
MIVAKPKVGTLFSLGVFIVICLLISGYAIGHYLSGATMEWYHYTLAIIFFPIGMGLLFRLLLGYRVVRVGKQKIEIHFPSRFTTRNYKLRDIVKWKEVEVKTVSGTFKELEIFFNDNKKIALSIQEHTDYQQLRKYMQKKCSKLKVDA